MWRYDAAHSGASPAQLAPKLHLQWVRHFPALRPAWPDQDRLFFDIGYEPIVVADTLFFGSSADDSVTALDVATGYQKWRVHTDGPVRFAPLAWRGRLYVACDDGFLYCLDAATGTLHWKTRGGPTPRKVLGNGRLIGMWPVRGAPVIRDGILYWAAGIWPFEGIFIHATDALTGERVWLNDGTGTTYMLQPHSSPAFAAVAPQGYMTLLADRLLVPGGRSIPACFDRTTGRMLYYHLSPYGKSGGFDILATRGLYLNDGMLFDPATGRSVVKVGPVAAATDDVLYASSRDRVRALYLRGGEHVLPKGKGGKPAKGPPRLLLPKMWELPVRGRAFIKAGWRLYVGAKYSVQAIDIPRRDRPPRISWEHRIAGTPTSMVAAAGRLFVVTREGHIHCFGPTPTGAVLPDAPEDLLVARLSSWRYLDDGSDPGPQWTAPDFDDSAWSTGRAQLGYGEKDEATVLGGRGKNMTAWFRTTFHVPDGRPYIEATLDALIDDGAVGYLNGVEAFRIRMPDGTIDASTRSTGRVREGVFDRIQLEPTLLVPGTNVLAIEVHQESKGSSDLSFDAELLAAREPPDARFEPSPRPADSQSLAARILRKTGATSGYCLCLGAGPDEFAPTLARLSDLHIVAVEPDPARTAALRRSLHATGLYGTRVAIHAADPLEFPFPPYIASLIVVNTPLPADESSVRRLAAKVFASLRPYGGTACLPLTDAEHRAFARAVAAASLERAELTRTGGLTLLTRKGSLRGAGQWTHHYGDAANTVSSRDRRVRAPLGILWFGGPTHERVLPRHGHGPAEQIVGGRLIIEGPDGLQARDVYTGRTLWNVDLPGLGTPYDNTSHQPGANALGSNYVSVHDGIYVAYGTRCLRLDPATGRRLAELTLPPDPVTKLPPQWATLRIWDDVLLAGARPVLFADDVAFRDDDFKKLHNDELARLTAWLAALRDFEPKPRTRKQKPHDWIAATLNVLLTHPDLADFIDPDALRSTKAKAAHRAVADYRTTHPDLATADATLLGLNRTLIEQTAPHVRARKLALGRPNVYSAISSRRLVAMDRYTGRVLWTRDATHGFLHNAIAMGDDKVFAIDRIPYGLVKSRKRRGLELEKPFELLALDARTGDLLWSTTDDVFGTWLGYSAGHIALLQAGRAARDMLPEVDRRMIAYRAEDGTVLWDKPHRYSGPCLLHDRTIITQGTAFDLLSGEPLTRPHPLTAEPIPWRFTRNYGCNTVIASDHLLTFRSAAAGYFDLDSLSGTANLGGFKSGCTSNLIVADGLLNAPDYTRTCVCSYQNQTSLAFVHMPDVEMWTFNPIDRGSEPVRRLGINLGAPGDRLDGASTLWLEYPSGGGPTPKLPITTRPARPVWFRHHASWVRGDGLKWVAASGARGIWSLEVTVNPHPSKWRSAHPTVLSRWRARPRLPLRPSRRYTVRLHLIEPDDPPRRPRICHLYLQGTRVHKSLNIAKAAGGVRTPLVLEYTGVEVNETLEIAFKPPWLRRSAPPVLCGVELIAED